MFELIASILAWFYDLYPSYGVAVVALTMVVMIVVTPLTLKSTRSMLQMQRLQPELKAIQNKHRDDRQKLNEELMAFYKANGINPLGGCLPMLVQLPVFLVLFRVVQGVTQRVTDIGIQAGWTAGRGGSRLNDVAGISNHELPFDPSNLPQTTQMYKDLTGVGEDVLNRPTEMFSFGMDLSRSALDVASESIVKGLPYIMLIVVVLVSSLYQQKQIRGRNTGAVVNPQQEMIMKILPFMLPVFSLTMPAALVVYFVISNLYRIGQQAYITKSLYRGEESLGAQVARTRDANRSDGANESAEKRAGSGGRTTEKKDQSGNKRSNDTSSKKTGSKKTEQSSKKSSSKQTGAGRTGNAPSRHHSSGGRTTEPGSPQHKKPKR